LGPPDEKNPPVQVPHGLGGAVSPIFRYLPRLPKLTYENQPEKSEMTPEESSSQRDMRLRRLENEMLRFLEDADRKRQGLTYLGAKRLLADVDDGIKERDEFEKIVAPEMLSSLYYSLSGELDALRKYLADAIARFEDDSQSEKKD
jgi:hypothetical protein